MAADEDESIVRGEIILQELTDFETTMDDEETVSKTIKKLL